MEQDHQASHSWDHYALDWTERPPARRCGAGRWVKELSIDNLLLAHWPAKFACASLLPTHSLKHDIILHSLHTQRRFAAALPLYQPVLYASCHSLGHNSPHAHSTSISKRSLPVMASNTKTCNNYLFGRHCNCAICVERYTRHVWNTPGSSHPPAGAGPSTAVSGQTRSKLIPYQPNLCQD